MKTLGINIDGVIRDLLSQFDKQYKKVYIYNPDIVGMNNDFTVKEYLEDELEFMAKKSEKKENDLISLPIDTADLLNHYQFNGDKELGTERILTPQEALDDFMYNKYPFQIFAMAEEYKNAMSAVNQIQSFGEKNKLFKTVLISKIKGPSITATFAFLQKVGCRAKNIMFIDDDYLKWESCDVVVDSMPEVFQSKPKGKISIKINHKYNQWDETDYSLDSINQLNNIQILEKIFK